MWNCRKKTIDLSSPRVMGIVNVTPDSFSDGGDFASAEKAIAHARKLAREGAAIIDIGAESTRPGHKPVAPETEIERLLPVVGALSGDPAFPAISIDTRHPETARAMLEAGAQIVNDVNPIAGVDDAIVKLVAEYGAGLVFMHWADEAHSDIDDVFDNLVRQRDLALAAGCDPAQLVCDPGIGFGKTFEQDVALLKNMRKFASVAPVLAGVSRKRVLGRITGEDDPKMRLGATVASTLWCAQNGVSVMRVHDVAENVQALQFFGAMK